MNEDVATLDERFAPVLDEARRQVLSGLRPSIQIAVDWRGERVVDLAVGHEPCATDRPYLLWSSTKPLVAVALLQLVEAGRVRLEDRVSGLLPEFARAGKEAVTLAHLLTHRGGFPDSTPETSRQLTKLQCRWDAALAYVCDMPALWEPGTDRGYHPRSAWFVLGEVLQRLCARPLAELVRRSVVEPAGLADDAFSLGEPERLAQPPMRVQTNGERGAPSPAEAALWNDPATQAAVIPGAGGISRANELVRFYRGLLDTLRSGKAGLLSHELVRAATFPQVVGIRDRTFLLDIPWGLGFHLKHTQPSLDDCGVTATPGTFGHGGHFLVNTAWADPAKDLVFCALSNGLAPSRAGRAGVTRLSQAAHDAVDRALSRT